MKEHEIRELVNELTKAARTYAHTQQLRAHMSRIVNEALNNAESKRVHQTVSRSLLSG